MKMRHFAFALPAGLFATTALAGPADDYSYGHMWGGGFGLMGGGLVMLVFWGVIIALIVFAIRWFSDRDSSSGSSSSALDILEERLARGEIDEEEFARRKAALNN